MQIARFLNKPEYAFRPLQIGRRALFRPNPSARIRMVNGLPITANTYEDIGRSIATYGVYDLVVSETIVRLLDPGELAVDVGANIGYMSAVMAACVGRSGRVVCFEPNPVLQATLAENVARWSGSAKIDVLNAAITSKSGVAILYIPEGFRSNHGVASLERADGVEQEVQAKCLDECFADGEEIGLLKIDVEGHELEAFRGASDLLDAKRIRDIIFEDHQGYPSPVSKLLESKGYRVFRLSRSFLRPLLLEPSDSTARPVGVLPNYVATIAPARAQELFKAAGWKSLRSR